MSPSSPLDHPRVLEWGMMTELLRVLRLCPLEIQVGGLHEQETSVCFLLEKSKPPLMRKMGKNSQELRTALVQFGGASVDGCRLTKRRPWKELGVRHLAGIHASRPTIIPEGPSG